MAKPRTQRKPVIEPDEKEHESNDPVTEVPAVEQDPVTENQREPDPIPEEGGRGEHSNDDPITRERVAEEVAQ
jgi:hypothetical protein